MFYLARLRFVLFASIFLFTSPAWSASYEFDEFTLDIDTTLTYGAQWRVQGPQNDLKRGSTGANNELDDLGTVIDNAFIINSNDGNNNFDTGLVANRLSFLTGVEIRWGDFGLFFRGKGWMDPVYANQSTDNDEYGSYNANPKFGTNGGHNADLHEFNQRTEDYMGLNGRFLDAFAYGSFYIGDRTLSIRLGRQVISWGEALLSGGGISTSTNHVDAQIRNTPGLEIKELFLPNGAIYGQFDITEKIGIEAYYQYEWQPVHLDPSGSYFSEFDSIGFGGETFTFLSGDEDFIFGIDLNDTGCDEEERYCVAPIAKYIPGRGFGTEKQQQTLVSHLYEIEEASDEGQFGVAFRYLFDNGGELGLYFVKYHDKIPSFFLPLDSIEAKVTRDVINALIDINVINGVIDASENPEGFRGVQDLGANLSAAILDELLGLIILAEEVPIKEGEVVNPNGEGNYPLDYSIKYLEDIRLYAASYSTVIGTTNVGAEFTYRPNLPILSGTVNRRTEREDHMQLALNALHIFGPSKLYDASTLIFEAVGWHIPGRTNFHGPGDYNDSSALAVQNTAQGWGYSFLWNFDYKNVIQGVDLVVPVYVNHGVNGAMLTSGFKKKQVILSVGVTAKYLSTLELSMNYATFFGSKKDVFQRLTSDRDNISFSVKYGF